MRQPGRLTLHGAGGDGASLSQHPSSLAPFTDGCVLCEPSSSRASIIEATMSVVPTDVTSQTKSLSSP